MNLNWDDLLTALALMLIFEGLSPFIWPNRIRQLALFVQQAKNRHIRVVAGLSMTAGLVLLYLVRS